MLPDMQFLLNLRDSTVARSPGRFSAWSTFSTGRGRLQFVASG